VIRALLLVLLSLASGSGQEIILGVLETGDHTMSIDTVTFYWGTVPDAGFVPWDWGGGPGTADTFEFELMISLFPAHVWLDYRRNGEPMPRETIVGLIPDHWYELPGFDDTPTRVKFLRPPGLEEGPTLKGSRPGLGAHPNPFRTSTALSLALPQPGEVEICDPTGRRVRVLAEDQSVWDGCDQAGRKLRAGIYLCRIRGWPRAPGLRLVKLD